MKATHEPIIFSIASFSMYLCGIGVLLTLTAMGGCGWRGPCRAPTTEFSIIVISHWIIIGLIFHRSVKTAKWLMVLFGTIPFCFLLWNFINNPNFATPYWRVIGTYLFLFGVLFPTYLFFSKKVTAYANS